MPNLCQKCAKGFIREEITELSFIPEGGRGRTVRVRMCTNLDCDFFEVSPVD